AVLEVAQPALKKAAEHLARPLGVAERRISGKGRNSRLVELFCEFFAEALERNSTPVDGVFHGTFGSGDVPAGELTVADCWELLPYENLLVTAEVSVSELLEILREDAGDRSSDRTLWPFELVLD